MKKPPAGSFERRRDFDRLTRQAGKEQYLVPLRRNRSRPQQVQDFMPTP